MNRLSSRCTRKGVVRAILFCSVWFSFSVHLVHSTEICVLVRRYERAEILSIEALQNTDRAKILEQCESVQDLAQSFALKTNLRISDTEALSSCLNSMSDLTEHTDRHILFPVDTALVKVRLKVSTEESIRDEIHGIQEWYPFAQYEGFLPAELYLRLVIFNTCLKNEKGAQFVVSDAFRPWTLSYFYHTDPDFGSPGLKATVEEHNGLISKGSKHSKGEAVDVYFIDVTGKCIEYPGQSCYHRTAERSAVDGKVLYEFIEESKASVGFVNLKSERTHFQLASVSNAMECAAEFPGLCMFAACRNDLNIDGVLLKKDTLFRITALNPGQSLVTATVLNGQQSGTIHSISRKDLFYPYLPVVAEVLEDIQLGGVSVLRGTLVGFSGVGDNDSLRHVQLLNDTLTFAVRIEDCKSQWRLLPYDSIGIIQGPMDEKHRGSILHINDANRDWVASFTELRRKQ